ncbi:peptidoglycan recognition family protein [Clostridium sp.]|uniref:peptidoglycan recognition protein family protein n=1 Tax=Clostridium sp. TaxID=1506 RepID=UPI0025B83C13|nr:peptidoglycan recognition family protein [Clostridium sp.]
MKFKVNKVNGFGNEFLYREFKINEVEYKWSSSLNYDFKPEMIVYHHTVDNNMTPQKIDEIHKGRGWSGIGYHFYIRKDGTIYRGRPENAVGAHAPSVNSRAFGIAIEGNFNIENLTQNQMNSIIELSNHLITKYNIRDLKRHKDVRNTECPGKNFPFEEIKSKLGL